MSVDEHRFRIQQLVPTTGPWLSIFEDGSVRPVACWALVLCETHESSYIAPMVPHEGDITDATRIEGYCDSLPEMDEEELEDESNDDEAAH